MKHFLIVLLVLPVSLLAQATMSCCATSPTSDFAMLAGDSKFRIAHDEPVPFHYDSQNGRVIRFKTSDGTDGSGFEIRAPKESDKYLFVIHEWWGLNDYIKQEAERIQRELGNVNVIALDLYDGKVATTQQEAGKFMSEAKEDRIRAIIEGSLDRKRKSEPSAGVLAEAGLFSRH